MPIKIEFERSFGGMVFRDALFLTDEELAAMSSEEIEAMKDARFNSWLAALTAGEE
jgi:hypothetical protein